MPGADVVTPGQRYKIYTVFVNLKTGVAYDQQDPIDGNRAKIKTTLNVFQINNRVKDYGLVVFRDSARVTSWAKWIINQQHVNYLE